MTKAAPRAASNVVLPGDPQQGRLNVLTAWWLASHRGNNQVGAAVGRSLKATCPRFCRTL